MAHYELSPITANGEIIRMHLVRSGNIHNNDGEHNGPTRSVRRMGTKTKVARRAAYAAWRKAHCG